jgi:Flp pilus assembly protein TadG
MSLSQELPANLGHRAADRRPWRRALRVFRKEQDGATAVEFAMVIMPFLALLFAIVETALVFWSTQVLETAVANASRTIYTGQFQQANRMGATAASEFRKALCLDRDGQKKTMVLFDCESSAVHVDVRRFTPGTPPPDVVKDREIDPTSFRYDDTAPSEIVLVRVAVEFPVFVNIIGAQETNLKNGKRLIMAAATFRNEPFSPPPPFTP